MRSWSRMWEMTSKGAFTSSSSALLTERRYSISPSFLGTSFASAAVCCDTSCSAEFYATSLLPKSPSLALGFWPRQLNCVDLVRLTLCNFFFFCYLFYIQNGIFHCLSYHAQSGNISLRASQNMMQMGAHSGPWHNYVYIMFKSKSVDQSVCHLK